MNDPVPAVVELDRYLRRLEGRRYLPPAIGRHRTAACSSCGCAIAVDAIACTSCSAATLDGDTRRKDTAQ